MPPEQKLTELAKRLYPLLLRIGESAGNGWFEDAFTKILLVTSAGVVSTYPPDEVGLQDALDASDALSRIYLPHCNIYADFTIPTNRVIIGVPGNIPIDSGYGSWITGKIDCEDWVKLVNLYLGNYTGVSGKVIGVEWVGSNNYGVMIDCLLNPQWDAGTEDIFCMYNGFNVHHFGCQFYPQSSGGHLAAPFGSTSNSSNVAGFGDGGFSHNSYFDSNYIGWLKADTHKIGERPFIVPVPSTATSTGQPGQIAYSSSFLYICTATNVWKRVAISTF